MTVENEGRARIFHQLISTPLRGSFKRKSEGLYSQVLLDRLRPPEDSVWTGVTG